MKIHYLDLEFASANFFEYSKTEAEGYEKHTSSKGNVSYRKYFNQGVAGTLESMRIKDSNFGKLLELRVDLDGEAYVMKFSLYTEKGTMDNRFAEPLICTLPNLEVGGAYRFYPYKMDVEARDGYKAKTFYGVSVKTANLETLEALDKIERAYTNPKKDEAVGPNHVPKLEFRERRGSFLPTAASIEAKEDFLDDLLQDMLVKFHFVAIEGSGNPQRPSSNTTSTKKQEVSKPKPKESPKATQTAPTLPAAAVEEDDDDLPF